MSKIKVLNETDKSTPVQETPLVMTGKAIGVGLDPTSNLWVVGVLEFNPATSQSKIIKVISSGTSKAEASEKFKIVAVEEGIVV